MREHITNVDDFRYQGISLNTHATECGPILSKLSLKSSHGSRDQSENRKGRQDDDVQSGATSEQ